MSAATWPTSCFSKPLVTPSTMLAIRLRVRPCSARCSPRSVGRAIVTSPSACSTFMSVERLWLSSPFGPLTATWPGAISTVTASGREIGFLPILLIARSSSPDVGDDLAADALFLRLVSGHHSARGADDRGACSAGHPRHVFVVDVAAPPGPGDPLQAGDDRPSVLRVLEADPD